MKSRLPVHFAGIAMLITAMTFAFESSGSVIYKRNIWEYGRSIPDITTPPVFRPAAYCAKFGSATLTVSGEHTYFGGETVFESGVLTIASGGSLTGEGTIQMGTLTAGSVLLAGNNSVTMTLNGDMFLSSGADMLAFDGSTLLFTSLLRTSELLCSNVFQFADLNSGIPPFQNGLFFDFSSNAVFTGSAPIQFPDGASLTIIGEPVAAAAPMFDGGNSALLTVIPEPASAMMLLFGAGVGLAVHRARFKTTRR